MPLAYGKYGIDLYHDNCLDILKILPDESIDCIVTDPPFGIAYVSQRAVTEERQELNSALVGDAAVDPEWICESARVLKTGGALYMFTRWDVWPQWYTETASCLQVKNMIVWIKSNHTAGDLYGNYAYKYELILFAVKGKHRPYWKKRETNVWTDASITSSEKRLHPTQKSLEVTSHCILNGTPPGGIVLDPFAGSATTLVAASLLGYQAIGVEVEQKYVDVAVERLKETE